MIRKQRIRLISSSETDEQRERRGIVTRWYYPRDREQISRSAARMSFAECPSFACRRDQAISLTPG